MDHDETMMDRATHVVNKEVVRASTNQDIQIHVFTDGMEFERGVVKALADAGFMNDDTDNSSETGNLNKRIKELEHELEVTRNEADAYVKYAVQTKNELNETFSEIKRIHDQARGRQSHLRAAGNLELALLNLEQITSRVNYVRNTSTHMLKNETWDYS